MNKWHDVGRTNDGLTIWCMYSLSRSKPIFNCTREIGLSAIPPDTDGGYDDLQALLKLKNSRMGAR